MRKTPRTDAVWERIAADLSLEPDVEFSTLARDLEDELYNALEKINRMEKAGDEAMYPLEYAARVRIWTEAKDANP
jgi:type II secretory pathway predicted ATPase ExeA